MRVSLALGCIILYSALLPAAEMWEKPQELRAIRFRLYENHRAKESYTIRYADREFVVYPNVFSPKYFPESFWFEKSIHIEPGDTFLEIGSGTGLISVMAALKGASYVATVDINPDAVKNTTENVFLHHVNKKVSIYEGDVFDPVPFRQKFDVIFWFAPFVHVDRERAHLTDLERALFDPQYVSLRKYLNQARCYLKPNGKLLLGFSPTHGHFDTLKELAHHYGWTVRVVAQEEQQIPRFPGGGDQVDAMTVMLIELNPNAPGVGTQPVAVVDSKQEAKNQNTGPIETRLYSPLRRKKSSNTGKFRGL